MIALLRTKSTLLILFLIVTIGLFFRLYQSYDWMLYGHDQDLAAWIVNDIVTNHHIRLVGQETSINGLFIGGLYYYSLIPFFLLWNMHPYGTMPFPIIIAVLTIISLYFVNTRLFNQRVGLLTSFLYAVSINHTLLDRWSVPTQPTTLWAVWFMYTIFLLARGNLKVLPILIILISLIWHIHIAFVPLLILVPIALYLSRRSIPSEWKNLKKTWLIPAFFIALVLLSPLVLFEIKHDFQQLQGLLNATVDQKEKLSLWMRIYLVIQNLGMTFLFAFSPKLITISYQLTVINFTWPLIIFALYALLFKFLRAKKIFSKNESIILIIWILIVFLGQTLTKRPISEYYFYNLLPLPLLFISLFIETKLKSKKFKLPIYIGLGTFMLCNLIYFTTQATPNREYLNIEKTINYIKTDGQKNNYQCFALNFFGEPSVGVGFRYPSLYHKLPLVRPTPGIPIYNIAVPPKSSSEVTVSFGDYGIIPIDSSQKYDFSLCNKPEHQQLAPNGFTN